MKNKILLTLMITLAVPLPSNAALYQHNNTTSQKTVERYEYKRPVRYVINKRVREGWNSYYRPQPSAPPCCSSKPNSRPTSLAKL